jgi:hypothetical protein
MSSFDHVVMLSSDYVDMWSSVHVTISSSHHATYFSTQNFNVAHNNPKALPKAWYTFNGLHI